MHSSTSLPVSPLKDREDDTHKQRYTSWVFRFSLSSWQQKQRGCPWSPPASSNIHWGHPAPAVQWKCSDAALLLLSRCHRAPQVPTASSLCKMHCCSVTGHPPKKTFHRVTDNRSSKAVFSLRHTVHQSAQWPGVCFTTTPFLSPWGLEWKNKHQSLY